MTIVQTYRRTTNGGTGANVERSQPKKGLQHTLNNPLGGLLAELQMLEMDDLAPAHMEAVKRCVALCRRLVQIVKDEVPPG